MKTIISLLGVMVLFSTVFCISSSTQPAQLLPYGHSHNDYDQSRPLFDALSLGFTSIEVDVHYYKSCLKVSHVRSNLKRKCDLERLYLKPLDSIAISNSGTIFSNDSTQLILMIEFKSQKEKAFSLFCKMLKKYDHLFQKNFEGTEYWGPIRILITGNPPEKLWKEIRSPYLYLDAKIGKKYPDYMEKHIYRLSSNIRAVIDLKLLKNSDKRELTKLKSLVEEYYKSGAQEVRFWKTPDDEIVWINLLNSGVNRINVDDIFKFKKFIQNFIIK